MCHPAACRLGRILAASGLAVALGLSGTTAAAQAADETPIDAPDAPALWEFRVAAFGRYAPVYPAASEYNLTMLPLPIPVYRGPFLNFGENLDQVARGEIVDTRRIRLGIDLDFTFGEDSDNIAVRNGMADLDFMFELGPALEIKLNNAMPDEGEIFLALQLRAGVSFDGLDPTSRGFLLNPELEYRRDHAFGGDNLLSLRWKPTWASEKYMDYYYEVEPAYATAERPAYDATSGYLGSKFTAAVTRQINPRLIFGLSASYYLYGGAENELSPLYVKDQGASVQAALIWTLAESERRASHPTARR